MPWIALAVAVLALGAAAAALLVAVQLRRALADLATAHQAYATKAAEPAPPPTPPPPRRDPAIDQLSAGIGQLHRRVAELERAGTSPDRRAPEGATAPRWSPPPSSPSASASVAVASNRVEPAAELFVDRPAPAPMPAPSPARSPEPAIDRAWVQGLLSDYARVAEDQAGALDRFLKLYDPEAVSPEQGGDRYVLGGDAESAMLWAVSAAADRHVLLPGPRALANWSGHFAASRTSAAQEYFGRAFELQPATPQFAVRRPAWLAVAEGPRRLALGERGVLEGFLN